MTFLSELIELEAKATEGPWEAGHPISKDHYGVTAYDHTYAVPQDINDARLIAYLRNHTKEIINLVEAAEQAKGLIESEYCGHDEPHGGEGCSAKFIYDALAALEKEQS